MTGVESLPERVRAFVRSRAPKLEGARAVLAVSGGADSCAMASLLVSGGIVARDSAIAHFDHRLRGTAESAAECAAVDVLAARLGLRVVHGAWQSPRHGEAAAREARHRFLRDVAGATDAAGGATGHTADDQAETVMMRIVRGAGVHGLGGMRAQGAWHGDGTLLLWRPLLETSRGETRSYCGEHDIQFHEDPSNADRRFRRNRLRLDVLPALEQHDPGIRRTLLALALDSRRVADAMDEGARRALPSIATAEYGSEPLRMSRRELREMPEGLLPHAFRLAVERLAGHAGDFGRVHYEALARAVSGRTGATYQLPRGLVATVDADAIVLSLGPLIAAEVPTGFAAPLPFAGRAGAWELDVAPAPGAGGGAVFAPPDAVVRRRRPGDRMLVRGRRRKLQDVLVDAKVPRRLRDAAPVIASGPTVLWTPFIGGGTGPCEGDPYAVRARQIGS